MFSLHVRECSGSHRRRLIVAALMLLTVAEAGGVTASAQQPTDTGSELLPTIVVSPTAIPTPADQVASSISVISAADIERDQRRTVPDALNTIPGLNVVQAGGPGGQTSVFMRGTNANHVKVLIDGIDASDPSNPNRAFDFGQLPTDDIDRIEVLRGPQSGLYGADAIGGVISITTKSGKGPPKISVMVEGGSFGTTNQAARLSGSADRFSYAFNVLHLRSTDTPVTPLELLPPGRARINDFYDNVTSSTKLGFDITENLRVNAVARHTDATLRFTGDDFSVFPAVPAAAQSTQMVSQTFARTEAVWSLFDNGFVNRFGVAFTDHWNWSKAADSAFGPAVPTINAGDRLKVDWQGNIRVADGHHVLLGLEDETERLRTSATRAQNGNRAGYAELQSAFPGRVFLVANVRYDDNERFGGHPTWRVAPAYIVPGTDTKLKASYGTGFKAPTLNQLFVSFPEFNFFANPNLRPETSQGYDAGFEQPLFNERVRFGATYFHNDIADLITTNATFTSLTNIGRAITQGVEAFASVAVTDRLRLRADYTYTEAIDAETRLQLLRRPWHKATVQTIWTPIDAFSLSATLIFVGPFVDGNRDFSIQRLTNPGYTVVNLAASYTIDEHVKVFGRVDNLFNVHYQNPTGFERPGLGMFAGLRVSN